MLYFAGKEGTNVSDVFQILFRLNLICVSPDGKTVVVLPNNGQLWLEVEDDVPDQDWVVYLVLVLDTDLYAARTWADNPDNRALAEVNAPRINGFLERLQETLGLTLSSVDADSRYREQMSGK